MRAKQISGTCFLISLVAFVALWVAEDNVIEAVGRSTFAKSQIAIVLLGVGLVILWFIFEQYELSQRAARNAYHAPVYVPPPDPVDLLIEGIEKSIAHQTEKIASLPESYRFFCRAQDRIRLATILTELKFDRRKASKFLEEALNDLNDFLRFDPKHHGAIYERIQVHLLLGEYAQAAADLKTYIETVFPPKPVDQRRAAYEADLAEIEASDRPPEIKAEELRLLDEEYARIFGEMGAKE